MRNTMTLDEALRPTQMTCINCNGQMTVYPPGVKSKEGEDNGSNRMDK